MHINTRKNETAHTRSLATPVFSSPTVQNSSQHAPFSGNDDQARRLSVQHEKGSPPLSIAALVAQHAITTPDALAATAEEHTLSYQELNQRANQLAGYLHARGIGADMLVGLCVERSLDMLIALLAILKAGAAYVPLDPSYPSERLAFMLEDAQVAALITHQKHVSQFSLTRDKIICLDALTSELQTFSMMNPTVTSSPMDLAYVIYTSGSTGQPKGVQVTHRNLLNLINWHQRAFTVTPLDRATQIASPAFDATGWEIWPYLTAGASIHVIDEETRLSPPLLLEWFIAQRITIAFLPTPLAERILTLSWPSTVPLRFLLTGGDVLHRYPSPTLPFTLVNNYGPTEATVVATSGVILPSDDPHSSPSIGTAIDNTQIYILDENLQPVPTGTTGELYIGGAGIARGYLRRPELTEERFIRDPFSVHPSDRLYKTGDLAYAQEDGQIVFIGRSDQQVKLRGFRIELGEIETILTLHPALHEVAATAINDGDEKRLVAYIVPHEAQQVNASMLRTFLQAYLPDYMIPATFVTLATLPLTNNGKVDRNALPEPTTHNILRDDGFITPETSTERRLASIVAPLLGLEQVSIDDNFFMLGGHSLLGTQLIARISAAFGVDLPLHTLFNSPTVRQLAQTIAAMLTEKIATMSEDEVQILLMAENDL